VRKHDDLVYDVGLHRGEDTDFYLKKGFRVVAFEADPDLVKGCHQAFAEQLATGQLTVVEGAIVEPTDRTHVTFYKNETVTVWGTTDPRWLERNERMGSRSRPIEVKVVDFGACLERYGMPHYLKIDIEGQDRVCLETLAAFDCRPDFVSMESDKLSPDAIRSEISTFEALGYDRFQTIQQVSVPQQKMPKPSREGLNVDHDFPLGASGLFGRDLPGRWQSAAEITRRYRWIMVGYRVFGNDSFMRRNRFTRPIWRSLERLTGRSIPGWYDTHAKHSSVS